MGEFAVAWLAGEGIVCWRSIYQQGGPPWPGQLLVSSGVFAIAAVIAEAGPGARRTAALIVWGVNIAAFMNLFSVALPNAADKGWWDKAKSAKIPPTQVLPSASCRTVTATASQGAAPSSPSITRQIADAIGNQIKKLF